MGTAGKDGVTTAGSRQAVGTGRPQTTFASCRAGGVRLSSGTLRIGRPTRPTKRRRGRAGQGPGRTKGFPKILAPAAVCDLVTIEGPSRVGHVPDASLILESPAAQNGIRLFRPHRRWWCHELGGIARLLHFDRTETLVITRLIGHGMCSTKDIEFATYTGKQDVIDIQRRKKRNANHTYLKRNSKRMDRHRHLALMAQLLLHFGQRPRLEKGSQNGCEPRVAMMTSLIMAAVGCHSGEYILFKTRYASRVALAWTTIDGCSPWFGSMGVLIIAMGTTSWMMFK